MLGLKLIHVSKRGPWNIPAPAPEGESFKALLIISPFVLVCLANTDLVTSQDVLCFTRPSMQAVVTVIVSLYWMCQKAFTDDKKALWSLSIIFHRDWDVFFIIIIFTVANDKRYSTLSKLVISITIIVIIVNKWYATISGVADENIDDAGNLHKKVAALQRHCIFL